MLINTDTKHVVTTHEVRTLTSVGIKHIRDQAISIMGDLNCTFKQAITMLSEGIDCEKTTSVNNN